MSIQVNNPVAGIGDLDPKDHDLLDGLGDDDHTQYILVNGTRDFSGAQSLDENNLTDVGTVDADVALLGGVTKVSYAPPAAVAAWYLNETTGTSVADAIGGITGTATTDISNLTQVGHIGNALKFNGSNQWVSLGTPDALDFGSSDFSIAFWLKPSNAQDNFAYYLSRGAWITDGWLLNSGNPLQIAFQTCQAGTWQGLKSEEMMAYGVWSFVVVRRAGANCEIIIDTVESPTYAFNVPIQNPLSNPARIGYMGRDGGGTLPSESTMDNISIYHKWVSDADILYLWNGGAGRETTGLGATDIDIQGIGESDIVTTNIDASDKGSLIIESELEVQGKSYTGGLVVALSNATADFTLGDTDYYKVIDATANTVTATLPTTPENGRQYKLACEDSTYAVTVARNGKLIANEAANETLVAGEVLILTYDDTSGSWW